MRYAICMLLFACRSDRGPRPEATATAPQPALSAESIVPPLEPAPASFEPFAGWETDKRSEAVQGAWVMVIGRPRVPVHIDRTHLKIIDPGPTTTTLDIIATAPCALVLHRNGVLDDNLPALAFAMRDGHVVLAPGIIGERRGREAIVCTRSGVYVLQANGKCTKWTYDGSWSFTPATCGFGHAAWGDAFVVDQTKLQITDNVIHDPLQPPTASIRVQDFAAAKALVAKDDAHNSRP